MSTARWPPGGGVFAVAFTCLLLAAGSCSDDSPTQPTTDTPSPLGAMPAVPKPTSLTGEAQSDTVTVIRPLLVAFAPDIYDARCDWQVITKSCVEELWEVHCTEWELYGTYPNSWFTNLPYLWGYRPSSTPLAKMQLLTEEGEIEPPFGVGLGEDGLNRHRCGVLDLSICWNEAGWIGSMWPSVAERPYLCRDRYWVVAGKSQILPEGFSQEITTTVVRGVEKTECDAWAASVSVEGQVQNGYARLKTAIEASYSSNVTETVFEQTSVETKYTPEPVPAGKQAVYQVWVLVDRYTITDRNGMPYTDPNYKFGGCKRVRVQGVWEAHAITYFPSNPMAASPAIE